MQLIYFFGGESGPKLFVDAPVRYITPAHIRHPQVPVPMPVLILEYTLESLGPVSAIIGAMAKKGANPQLYFWDLEKPEPEVALVFRVENPCQELLATVAGRMGEVLNPAFLGHEKAMLFCTAEANLNQKDVQTCIAQFTAAGVFVVDVREASTGLDDSPLQRFVTRDVFLYAPSFVP